MSFKFTVHDVGLGQFLTLEDGNGFLMVWDCGRSDLNYPSEIIPRLGYESIDRFFVTNFDQDHIEDLPSLRAAVDIRSLTRNKSISPIELRALKENSGPITAAMEALLEMHDAYNSPLSGGKEYIPSGVSYRVFANDYSPQINDTNNLSQVTILNVNGFKIAITGDLERKGWEALLGSTPIADHLLGTDVFIASHHGRENGYHQAVLELASPSCVVMSDYEIKHATQDSLELYRRHCSGVQLNGETRRILTTRKDHTITWKL